MTKIKRKNNRLFFGLNYECGINHMKYSLATLSFLLAFTGISQSTDSSLLSLSKNINLELGSAFYYRDGWDKSEYENIFLDNFSHLTPEGGMVWGEYGVSPDSGQINFWGGDRIIGFAHENDIKVKAQHLVWHRYFDGSDPLLPDWLVDDEGVSQYNKEDLSMLLKNFINQTVHHYTDSFPETIKWWCVINEPGSNTTGYIPNLWLDSLGSAHIDSSFIWARAAAGPEIKLYYNEYFYHGAQYGGARIQSKIDFAHNVVSGMIQRGVPIDGMGFQSHIPAIGYPGKEIVAGDMKRFTDLGLEVYITELDIELTTPVTHEKLEKQANIYKEIFQIAIENPLIKLVCLWQFNDAQSWLGAGAESCIMDSLYNPKPAYDSIQSALMAADGTIKSSETRFKINEVLYIYESKIKILHTKPALLTIYDMNGQIVNRLEVSREHSVPIDHLKTGTYIATLATEKNIWKIKFSP